MTPPAGGPQGEVPEDAPGVAPEAAEDAAVADDPRPFRRGVGIVLLNPDGLVFVGQRLDMPGAWQMPQGGIDGGETPAQAAVRELFEETGVREARLLAETRDWLSYDLPRSLSTGRLWKGRFRGQTQKWFAFRFTGRDEDIDLAAHLPQEFCTWAWQPADQVAAAIVPFKQPVYRQVFAAFADLLRPAA